MGLAGWFVQTQWAVTMTSVSKGEDVLLLLLAQGGRRSVPPTAQHRRSASVPRVPSFPPGNSRAVGGPGTLQRALSTRVGRMPEKWAARSGGVAVMTTLNSAVQANPYWNCIQRRKWSEPVLVGHG